MRDEIKIQNLEEGRLSDVMDNKRALLVGIYRSTKEKPLAEENLKELERLSDTYGAETVKTMLCSIKKFDASTYIGKGKVQEIAELCEQENIGMVIFDNEISPHQQRNLEKIFKIVTIDRSELILGVFFQHAKTTEAKLQVALAQSKYQLPRLKRLWTHLSRQRVSGSGGGHLKGAGERQIEIDRRLLRTKISKLQKKIEEIKGHRDTQRSQRERTKIPTFAIVGYTNAGKSTLLKALTDADVLIEDKLFATLDTTTRKYILSNNQEVLLIDTVGFIRKIPHTLVAAFKSTLEELSYADILLHIIDVSSSQAREQAIACVDVLKELKVDDIPIITVFNKTDKAEDEDLITDMKLKYPKSIKISALEKTGFEDLLDMMEKEIALLRKKIKLKIPQSHYKIASLIMKEGRIISQEYEGNYILIEAEIPKSLETEVDQFICLD
jgi:GTP-binding protein HflX